MLKAILTANWRYLAFLNFAVDRQLLASRVPAGTELDIDSNGTTYLSIVAFLCADTVLVGEPLPRQRMFERIDIRFYVRRKNIDDWRRGTVLLRAIVPRVVAPALTHAFPAEALSACTTRNDIIDHDGNISVEYAWRAARKWESLAITAAGETQPAEPGSHSGFITDRPWRYTALASRVDEYRIVHPRWRIWPAATRKLDADVTSLCGNDFAEVFQSPPISAFIADGSHVEVQRRETAANAR